ncbi:ABC transporter permease subunit [Tissierella carlieri]|uniref:ABC transporter permease n=1 Tax=Tissierella TaxID=41273 RepID=UPI000BA073DF|nr:MULTISPECIES: ABC transporter permease subunit [Tissierella]MBU5311938.1 ABC transporter permease subunit [Tissierella carlieri]OZV13987.1 spermidine/putrescine ABC transporter permease [Tissierella sp. P1]
MREKLKPYLLLFPILFVLITIFVSGIIMGLIQSLGYFKAVGLTEFTLKYYKEVLTSKGFISSLRFSLYTSFTSSIMAVVCGVLLSYAILQVKGKKEMVESLYRIPIIVPHIVSVLLVYNILSQSGILPRILYEAGLITDQSQFPSILYERNGIGVIIAYLWKEIPFVALTTYTILSKVSSKLSDVAGNLGANKRQIFFYILLPLIMPSVFSSFIIIFAFSFGAYEVPLLLGPTQPKALSVQAFIEYNNPVLANRPYAMVYNILITLIALILTWLYYKAFEKAYKYGR